MKKVMLLILVLGLAGFIFIFCSKDSSTKVAKQLNKVPTCEITSPTNNQKYSGGEIIKINVDAADKDGSISEVRFYVDGNRVGVDSSFPYMLELNTVNYIAGTHSVKVISKDNSGAESSSEIDIVLSQSTSNTSPVASFIVSPSSGTAGTKFQFDASGCSDSEDSVSSLQVRWDFDGNGTWDANWSTDKTESYQYSSTGNYNVKLQVKDTKELDNYVIQSVTVSGSNATPSEMVFVEGGTFQMGDHFKEGDSDELPLHDVTVSSFYIGKYEVTQGRYKAAMGSNPSNFSGDNNPVETVTWYNAVAYCNSLSVSEGLEQCYTINGTYVVCDFTKNGYRLPTEAEWKYAAHGGVKHTDNYKYSGTTNNLGDYAWYAPNSGSTTHEVGTKLANQLGIHDMSGNVYEWCWDWHGSYVSDSQTNPTGATSGSNRIFCGGSWYAHVYYMRVANRGSYVPSYSDYDIGFRLLRIAE